MQSLWSRAGQARHCGCRTCNQVLNGVGRRATTGVRRRKPTFAEIFTACYSSVFASAAMLDAVRKENRKQELDRQLEEARRELAALQQQAKPAPSSADFDNYAEAPLYKIDDAAEVYRRIKQTSKNRPFMREIKDPVETSASYILSLQREYYDGIDEASVKALGQMDYEALERGLVAEQNDDTIHLREAQTDDHLLSNSIRSVGIVKALLRSAYEITENERNSPTPTVDAVRELLVQSSYPHYTFPSVDWRTAQDTMKSLHHSFQTILATPDIDLKEKVGKICYNLLVCPYPSDMHTYNTLIVAFDKAGLYRLSEDVVYSFRRHFYMMPTPLTWLAVLNHCKESGLVGRWMNSMAVLAGADRVSGSKLPRTPLSLVQASPRLTRWAADTKRRSLYGDYYFEHVPMRPPLLEHLLHGLIHFKLLVDAVKLFAKCMQRNIVLSRSTRVVRHLMDAILLSLDWRAAIWLIKAFARDNLAWLGMIDGADPDDVSYIVHRMYDLLDMTGLYSRGRPISHVGLANSGFRPWSFQRLLAILEEAMPPAESITLPRQRAPTDDPVSASKSMTLQTESLWKAYVMSKRTIESIELKLLHVRLSLKMDKSMAFHIGSAAVETSLNLSQKISEVLDGSEHLGRLDSALDGRGRRTSRKPRWDYDMGVWVHDSLKDYVARHASVPLRLRTSWLERPKLEGLEWLDDWESMQSRGYEVQGSRLPERSFFWEGREVDEDDVDDEGLQAG